MEEENIYKTPSNFLAKMQVVHFGKILFNLQFIALAIMLASIITFIMPAIYYLMLIAISFLTIFSIYVWYPNFSSFWTGGETLLNIADVLTNSWQYTIPIALALAVASIICLCFDGNKKHIGRIVVSVVISVVLIVILISKLINGGGV